MKKIIGTISKGVFLILIGVIFLLTNFNYLSWSFWWNVVDLWPLILVLAGIGLLFNKRIPFSAVLTLFLLILIGYSLVFGIPSGPFNYFNDDWTSDAGLVSTALDLPADPQIERVNLDVDLGATSFDIHALSGQEEETSLLKGNFGRTGSGNVPQLKSDRSGDTMNVKLSTTGLNLRGPNKLDLGLSDQPEYQLKIDAGAVKSVLNFDRLKVDELSLDIGASDTELHFGDTGAHSTVSIDGAASKIKLIVPATVGIRIKMDGITSGTNFAGSGLIQNQANWVSANYDQAETKIDMDISLAAGSVELARQ